MCSKSFSSPKFIISNLSRDGFLSLKELMTTNQSTYVFPILSPIRQSPKNNCEPSSGLSRQQRAQRQRRDQEKIKSNGKCLKEQRPHLVSISAVDLLYVDLLHFQILPSNRHCDGNSCQLYDMQRDEAQPSVIHNIIRQSNDISPQQWGQRQRRDRERMQIEDVSSVENDQSQSMSKYPLTSLQSY